MSNKLTSNNLDNQKTCNMNDKTPKEIYLNVYNDDIYDSYLHLTEIDALSRMEINGKTLKYLSEEHFNSLIEEKDKEIERLKEEFYKSQYSDAMNGVYIYQLQCDLSLMKTISLALTDELNSDLESLLDSCRISGEVEIVKYEDIPKKCKQDEDFGIFKDIYIDQWSIGDSGDSYAGFIYARIDHKKKKTWIKIPYDC